MCLSFKGIYFRVKLLGLNPRKNFAAECRDEKSVSIKVCILVLSLRVDRYCTVGLFSAGAGKGIFVQMRFEAFLTDHVDHADIFSAKTPSTELTRT